MTCAHCLYLAHHNPTKVTYEGEPVVNDAGALPMFGEGVIIEVNGVPLPQRAITTVDGTALCGPHAAAIIRMPAL